MSYNVKLEVFEGPFDLLVYLIEKSKMNIYDINVSEITAQYMAYMQQMKTLDVELSSDFLVLAATLIHIKSAMLLPGRQLETEEDGLEEDPRAILIERIIEYRKFKNAATYLSVLEDKGAHIFVKPQEDLSTYADASVDQGFDPNMAEFVAVFRRFLLRKQAIEDVRRRYSRMKLDRMTLEDKMSFLLNTLTEAHVLSFSELIAREADLFDIVLTFLGILELMKNHLADASQNEIFGEIILKSAGSRELKIDE